MSDGTHRPDGALNPDHLHLSSDPSSRVAARDGLHSVSLPQPCLLRGRWPAGRRGESDSCSSSTTHRRLFADCEPRSCSRTMDAGEAIPAIHGAKRCSPWHGQSGAFWAPHHHTHIVLIDTWCVTTNTKACGRLTVPLGPSDGSRVFSACVIRPARSPPGGQGLVLVGRTILSIFGPNDDWPYEDLRGLFFCSRNPGSMDRRVRR